ncbi:MAG: hypothetical protein ACXVKJ_18515, partial [Ilumatobacteraceae bacterium]
MRIGQPHRRSPRPGHAPATQLDQHLSPSCHAIAVAKADPVVVFGSQLQIGAQRRHSDGEQHNTSRLHPGLQPPYRTSA